MPYMRRHYFLVLFTYQGMPVNQFNKRVTPKGMTHLIYAWIVTLTPQATV